jgi:hypothetical protein
MSSQGLKPYESRFILDKCFEQAEGKTIMTMRDKKNGQSSKNYIRLYKHQFDIMDQL